MRTFPGTLPHRAWMLRTAASPDHGGRGAGKAAAGGFSDADDHSTARWWNLQPSSTGNKKGGSSTRALFKETHFLWHRLDFLAKQQLRAFTSASQISIAQKRRLVEGFRTCTADNSDRAGWV